MGASPLTVSPIWRWELWEPWELLGLESGEASSINMSQIGPVACDSAAVGSTVDIPAGVSCPLKAVAGDIIWPMTRQQSILWCFEGWWNIVKHCNAILHIFAHVAPRSFSNRIQLLGAKCISSLWNLHESFAVQVGAGAKKFVALTKVDLVGVTCPCT